MSTLAGGALVSAMMSDIALLVLRIDTSPQETPSAAHRCAALPAVKNPLPEFF